MGVYVFDMEMPRSCNECRFSVNGFCRASPKLAVGAAMSKRERTNYCPLVYVPPHGRLIDADALTKMCREMQSIEWNKKASPYSWEHAYEEFENDIFDAPTIIPAEDGE